MLILAEKGLCFVCTPKTGGQAIAKYIENLFPDRRTFNVERLHYGHANLQEVEESAELGFSIYNMRSVAVVRNPFDRLVSYCASTDPGFHLDHVSSIRNALFTAADDPENRWLKPQGFFTQGVKVVYRFENFKQIIQDLSEILGVDYTSAPVVNDSVHERYQKYFDNELKGMVEEIYADDLREFGYRF